MSNNINRRIVTSGNGFCVVSNIEYGSDAERLDRIKEIYEVCETMGIDTIIHCGNLAAKFKQQDDKSNVDVTLSIIERIVNSHPFNPNINFYTLSGINEVLHQQSSNINIGEVVAKNRDDIAYLGDNEVTVIVDELKIKLCSGENKDSLSESYKARRFVDDASVFDLVCIGSSYSPLNEKIGNTSVLGIPCVSDVGNVFSHIVWFVSTNNKGNINIIDYKLDSSIDKKTEEDIKTDATMLQRIMKLRK